MTCKVFTAIGVVLAIVDMLFAIALMMISRKRSPKPYKSIADMYTRDDDEV